MKRIKILLILPVFLINIVSNAQELITPKEKDELKNYINKGDLSISVLGSKINNCSIQDFKYGAIGGEGSFSYYIFNRIGIETSVSVQNYHLLDITSNKINNQDFQDFDKLKLVALNERIRYNFYDKPHCATSYIQSGYSFGWFNDSNYKKNQRWEIATLGIKTPLTRRFIDNLDCEFTMGIAKDNFNDNIYWNYKMGLSYYLGNIINRN